MIDLFCLIYYTASTVDVIPSVYRIWKRKSSFDYSRVSALIELISNVSWAVYIYLTEQTMLVYIGTTMDLVLQIVYIASILRYYHNPISRHKI